VGLNISQPAVSRQIRDLEAELGVSLFERRTGRLVLTGEGEELLARSRELLSGAESLRDRARALRGGDEGLIRVGVAHLTLESLMPTFLAQHQRRHPKIDVRLAEHSLASNSIYDVSVGWVHRRPRRASAGRIKSST